MPHLPFRKVHRLQVFYLGKKRLIKESPTRAINVHTKRLVALHPSVMVNVPVPREYEVLSNA